MENDAFSQLRLRLPNDLKKQIVIKSKINKRSMNAEIIDCIEKAIGIADSTRSAAGVSIDKLLVSITNMASKTAERKFALDSLDPYEKSLLLKLDTLPKEKKAKAINSIISLLNDLF